MCRTNKVRSVRELLRMSLAVFATCAMVLQCAPYSAAQSPASGSAASGQSQQPPARIHVNTDLVLVNVVARDKKGNLVRDLKKEDFAVFEDNKKQDISSFDFENVDALQTAGNAEATVTGVGAQGSLLRSSEQPGLEARDRRLMLLFFDFSAMDPEQIDRSVDAAKKFVQSKMQPADLVAVVSLSTNLRIDLDFTDDRAKLQVVLSAYASGEGQGFDNGTTGTAEGA